jgi:hypothetical protein
MYCLFRCTIKNPVHYFSLFSSFRELATAAVSNSILIYDQLFSCNANMYNVWSIQAVFFRSSGESHHSSPGVSALIYWSLPCLNMSKMTTKIQCKKCEVIALDKGIRQQEFV